MPRGDHTESNALRSQIGTAIRRLQSGRFKVYWQWGAASAVGLGPNFKHTAVPGQPVRGFDTLAEAKAFESAQPLVPAYWLGEGYSVPERDFRFCLRCGAPRPSPYGHVCAPSSRSGR